MNGWNSGFVIGLAAGLSIGLAAGRKSKPWSELSEKEKKIRIGLMVGLGLAVLAGVVTLLVVR
jgi:hypothetical protein